MHPWVDADTTDVQTAVVIFFENNIFLSCSFASGSVAFGCEFQFQVNLNGTSEGLEEFVVERSGVHGSLCSASSNQRNGYMTISVLDLEQDRMTRGSVALTPGEQVLETEADYMQQTGCSVQRGKGSVPLRLWVGLFRWLGATEYECLFNFSCTSEACT